MIGHLLDHTCDIYHVESEMSSPGYGLPAAPNFKYGPTPDAASVKCHFGVHNSSVSTSQQQPHNDLNARLKLYLPVGTDIRLNDKIVNCENGLAYTAELPRNIRNHHLTVYIKRTDAQRPL